MLKKFISIKISSVLIFLFSMLFSSCISERGEFILPPTNYEIHMISGSAKITVETLAVKGTLYTSRPSDFFENENTLFKYESVKTTSKEDITILSAGDIYTVIVQQNHQVNVQIQPLMEDCKIEYYNSVLLDKKEVEIPKEQLFGGVLTFKF